MSNNKNDINNFLLNKISEIEFEAYKDVHPIIPSESILINENTFAFICYHYNVKCGGTIIDYINFYSYNNNNFILVDQYKFDNKIIEDPSDFVQMKVENEKLIIITKQYLLIDKIFIYDGKYSFKNVICRKLDEIPYKILDDLKIVFLGKILKICQFSLEGNDKKCLFELSYDIFKSDLFKHKYDKEKINRNKISKKSEEEENNNESKSNDVIEQEEKFDERKSSNDNEEEGQNYESIDEEDEDYIFENVGISNKICDILEIKEKNLIIIEFRNF